MDITDALTVTALGMAVVFFGLFLTAMLITSFALIPRLIRRSQRTPIETTRTTSSPSTPEVAPDVLAVITTVLEIERRLFYADPGGRLTIARRNEVPHP